jgi:hypothetical protein
MMAKLKRHRLALFLAGLLFLFVYKYFAIVDPLYPLDGDDWRYFGTFASYPLPKLGLWNVTRIFPENLMPTIGYFSAFVIYPLVGDYLASASIALAIMAALFITALFLAFYRLFIVLCDSKRLGLFFAVMMIALCFAIFKDNYANNYHMFFASMYNLYFFYVFPNILNAIIVLELMRQLILNNNLSILQPPSPSVRKIGLDRGWLLVGIYLRLRV